MLSSFKEWLRYERHWSQALLFPLLVLVNFYYRMQSDVKHVGFLSKVFRLSWPGTYGLVTSEVKKRYLDSKGRLKNNAYDAFVNDAEVLDRYKQFSENPASMLDGIITVVAPRSETSKGIITIAYSYYFTIFLKYFDYSKLEQDYYVVLEPSWNGLCDESILAFARFASPVFVMAYEERDYAFIASLNSNLIPLKLSANWWISPDQFTAGKPQAQRDIDVIMVAAWAQFKRHGHFFKAINELKQRGRELKVTLIGYPNDMQLSDIQALAIEHDVENQISFYEWISPEEVSSLLGRAKVNIIWSRFEGLNRAIIEGMFCDTPCILREGFNFGMRYPYINSQTGCYSKENALPDTILEVIDNPSQFSPRDYVLKHHNCYKAAEFLGRAISEVDSSVRPDSVVPKLSGLNGMEYLNDTDQEKFKPDYHQLRSLCVKGK